MNLFDLSGRVAVVTGGNGGIGLGMARGLARAGANILVAGRNTDKNAAAEEALADLGVESASVVVDVTKPASCQAMVAAAVARFGRLDILVNNAGTNTNPRSVAEIDPAEWDRLLAVNLTGAFNCVRAVLPDMRAQKDGLIINVSSIAGALPTSISR